MDFRDSETRKNLMRAFAGESQARNRYTFAADAAKKKNLFVIERIFRFTAEQEKEHAEIFYQHLSSLSGETIHIDGGYPVDISDKVEDLLLYAQHNEYEEFTPVYSTFAQVAEQEGFAQVAYSFSQIAKIEKSHGDRFGYYAKLLKEGHLFADEEATEWMCLNCGHIHSGKGAPTACPVCSHAQGYFIRLEESPYTEKEMLSLLLEAAK